MTASWFREWRRRMGMTQAEAARTLGVSPDLVGSIEQGRRVLRQPLERLCRAIERERAAGAAGQGEEGK